MTAAQAKALLALIADLYLLASTPEPAPPVPAPVENGTAVKENRLDEWAASKGKVKT